MARRTGRVELTLVNDQRLVAGVAGAIEFFAEKSGLGGAARAELVAATEAACRGAFRVLKDEVPTLNVTVESFADRLEVVLEHRGEPLPAAGLDTYFGAKAGQEEMTGQALISRVDRVRYQTENGTSRMTLVKYLKK